MGALSDCRCGANGVLSETGTGRRGASTANTRRVGPTFCTVSDSLVARGARRGESVVSLEFNLLGLPARASARAVMAVAAAAAPLPEARSLAGQPEVRTGLFLAPNYYCRSARGKASKAFTFSQPSEGGNWRGGGGGRAGGVAGVVVASVTARRVPPRPSV